MNLKLIFIALFFDNFCYAFNGRMPLINRETRHRFDLTKYHYKSSINLYEDYNENDNNIKFLITIILLNLVIIKTKFYNITNIFDLLLINRCH
uniref:Uncharacterized protein n=1 Tax=viral metagenome TaxID=1070528 RepID=A0A6C0CFI6_9ZZZZ